MGSDFAWVQEPYWRAQTDQRQSRTLASLPTFRGAYAKRRCIVPVESFFEWRAIKGARAKQPYAVAMKDRTPFTIAGLWENWHHPQSGVSSSRDRNSLRIGEVFDLL
ncbi:MAG: SOS response-associated peptidase family protein [Methyloceanibacter sp.]